MLKRRGILTFLLSFVPFGILSARAETAGSSRLQKKGNKMVNPVVHFEVLGQDGERLQQFYRDLFDWKIDANNPNKYGYVTPEEGGIRGGIATGQNGVSMQTFYVQVENLQATLDKANELGGKTIMPPTEIPGANVTIAMVGDPEGHVIGLVLPPA